MSRKTMDEYPLLYNIWAPPPTTWPTNDDERAEDLIAGTVNTEVVGAYKRYRVGHLEYATEDFTDSLWGINEGKRDARVLKE